jgi:hypothetical protein
LGSIDGSNLMYFLTHVTFQGVFLVTLVAVTAIGMWWADR